MLKLTGFSARIGLLCIHIGSRFISHLLGYCL